MDSSWSGDDSDGRMRQGEDRLVCGGLGRSYAGLVFTSVEGESMWTTRAMKSMCGFDETWVSSHRDYLCEKNPAGSCCPSWTLGNYIADLSNKSSCLEITEQDANDTLTTLRSCAEFYRHGTLGSSCWDWDDDRRNSQCSSSVPDNCYKYDAVYQILRFLVDKDFLMSLRVDAPPAPLRYSMLFLPIWGGGSMENIYLDNLENRNLSDGITTVTGMEFNLTIPLFMHYVLKDAVYLGIAVAMVLLVLLVYTRSVCVTFMTMITIFSSFTVSHFLYRVVFSIGFFPFLNLITLIVLLGIGADDAFVLCDAWNCAKNDRPDSRLSERVSVTLRHAALSMFVTSFTTAAAFYTNLMSDITAMRCFGVFAGTAILVNYALMVTWMPAVVVLHERYLRNLFTCVGATRCQTFAFWTTLSRAVDRGLSGVSEASRWFFEKALPVAVIKLRYLWLLLFSTLMLGGACVVFVNPKMKLPTRELDNLKMFHSSHPFERYLAEYKKLFEFVDDKEGEPLPIRIIWGFLPIDNGDPLNPKKTGTLTPDTTFDVTSSASQEWILNFCQKLQNQSFVSLKQDDCSTVQSISPNSNNQLMELEFRSTYNYSRDNKKMHQFYSEVEAWLLKELRDAPQGLRNGWFHSELDFYDLQNSLLNGTMMGMAVSVVLAFAVMLLTTRNVIISLYAMGSIAGTIFVTVGALVLLGWELNLIESLAISVSLGLSVDFAVHFGVSYCLAPGPERHDKVVVSLSRMGLAITMAALTTFVTGAMMMPCTIVPFTLMGAFLMLIMSVSWAFATFFFQSLCRSLGPQGTFGQIPLPKKLQCFSSH